MFACSHASEATARAGCLCHRPEIGEITRRVESGLSRRAFLAALSGTLAAAGLGGTPALAQFRPAPLPPPGPVLLVNVRIFDGLAPTLAEGRRVRVEGGRIVAVEPADAEAPEGAILIDGGGRVLMPGLIDVHTHLTLSSVPLQLALTADPAYLLLRAARAAEDFLEQGFTTARDVGGPIFPLKRAIDDGTIAGPRIWPSGAMISQTSGHGDFRSANDLPRSDAAPPHFTETAGGAAIADGVPEVLRRVREQLFLGASQIKLMAGGGVTSDHDPLDSAQYNLDELRAAVGAAGDWNTYVTVHAYTPKAIARSIEAGVLCVEHGQLADEATARLMAEHDIWWSLQPFLDDEDATPFPEGSPQRAAALEVYAGTDAAYALARRFDVKTAFGTDTLFSERTAARQGAQLAKLARWYTPAEALSMATARNGELLALSGPRAPYPGKVGVIEAGALADLILVDGEPLRDLSVIADRGNIALVMKGGVIHKNTI